jgi:V/A-type H+-transporting ATPase subunit I
MFYPQEMTQVRLIIPARDLLAVTNELAAQGVFHQVEGKYPASEKIVKPAGSWVEKASAYASLERRILGIMQVLEIEEGAHEQPDKTSMVDYEAIHPAVDQVEQEVNKTREKWTNEQKRLEQLQNMLDQLEPLAGINLDLNAMRHPAYIHTIMGVMPTPNIERLRTSLAKIPFVFYTLRQDAQTAVVWLAAAKQNAEVLDRAARSAYLNPLSLPETYQGTPAQIIAAIQADMDAANQQISEHRSVLSRLAGERGAQLPGLLWQVRASRILAEAIGRFGRYRYTYLIDGWVPSSGVDDFSRRLKEVSQSVMIETSAYKRGGPRQNAPVALNNPGLIRPFQGLVTNYARPLYEEIDPTFLLAITFPFLFGAMFGDVGQGLLLALLGLLLASGRIKALSSMAGLGGVVAGCGLSAAVFGVLYGSIFGFEDILHPLIFRPTDNILQTLSLAIGIGVVLLSVGFLLNIINAWTSKDLAQLLFEPKGIAGLVLYWSLVGLGLEVITGQYLVPPLGFGILALLTGLIVMFSETLKHLVEGHRPLFEGGFPIYALQAALELFETLISLLSNSISFVRVGAFAVAHVGLTIVIFIMAGLVSPTHGVGYYVVIALGNLFIIGFEGIIVGIQTMRLSYYEMFSKFFKGGGMQYEPLTLLPRGKR